MLTTILADLDGWKQRLPEELHFRGPDTPRNAGSFDITSAVPTARLPLPFAKCSLLKKKTGLLFLFYCCVNMLFWRVFMRISYACPEHLKFALTVEKWSELNKLTGDAIDWLDANERLYDVWLLVAYCATSCALVQVRSRPKRSGYRSNLMCLWYHAVSYVCPSAG